MELNTAAAVIKYVSKLELDSSELYDGWSKVHKKVRDSFEKFSRENKKNEQKVKRTYYSVVSDALETAFCFKGFQSDLTVPRCREGETLSEILEAAIRLENAMKAFYTEAADLSKCLLADVPREMQKLANARDQRIKDLTAMFQSEKTAQGM